MERTSELFRDVLGRLASGVTVVTTRDNAGEPRGLTATAVCSVSLEPPLVLVCIGRDSQTCQAIPDAGRYALNLLSSNGRDLSDRFAAAGEGKFGGVAWHDSPRGCPLLDGCLGWVECDVERQLEAGDHTIFVGRVVDMAIEQPEGEPLIHFDGRYRSLRDEATP